MKNIIPPVEALVFNSREQRKVVKNTVTGALANLTSAADTDDLHGTDESRKGLNAAVKEFSAAVTAALNAGTSRIPDFPKTLRVTRSFDMNDTEGSNIGSDELAKLDGHER